MIAKIGYESSDSTHTTPRNFDFSSGEFVTTANSRIQSLRSPVFERLLHHQNSVKQRKFIIITGEVQENKHRVCF